MHTTVLLYMRTVYCIPTFFRLPLFEDKHSKRVPFHIGCAGPHPMKQGLYFRPCFEATVYGTGTALQCHACTHIPEQSLETGSSPVDPSLELYSSTGNECSVASRLLSKWSELMSGENTGKDGATSGSYPAPIAQI